MIIKPDILQRTLDFAKRRKKKNKVIMLSANGKKFCQNSAKRLLKYEELLLICGRYEGVDQRFIDFNLIEEISVGDYVLSGGKFLHLF